LKPWKVPVKVGNAANIYSEMKGTYHSLVTQGGRRTVRITLEDVLYIPDMYINLFSMTNVLANPSIDIKKEKGTITFIINKHKKILLDKIIPVGEGMLIGVDISPLIENLHTAVVEYQALHERLGHANDKKVAATAKQLGIKYTGQPRHCEHCAQAKLRIKNIPKVTTHIAATGIVERIMFDISSVKVPSTGGNTYWLLIMDEYSGFLWSYFFRYRDDLPVTMTDFVKQFPRKFDTNIVRFRCDNAGENKSFQATLNKDMPYEIQFEYTAPYTPQQNGRIERKFATLYGKIRALSTAAQFQQKLRNDLWPHAALLVTDLKNTIVDTKGSTPHFILTGTNPNWVKNLRTFGEIGIVYTKPTKIHNLENRGNPCIFIGYAEVHTSNVFKFYNPKTYAAILSRKVYWLNKSYGEFYKVKPTASPCEIRQVHRNIAEVTNDIPDRKDPPSNAVARAMIPILIPSNHQSLRTYHILLLTMITHLFNRMLLPLLVLNPRYLKLLLHLMCLIPGHASLVLVVRVALQEN
jgi:hypothetical protein